MPRSLPACAFVLAAASAAVAQSGWLLRNPSQAPSARHGHALAYDVARGVTVLFGGIANPVALGDTWEWNGSNWTQRFPANAPSPRLAHAMAFDSARNRVVVFGGAFAPPVATVSDETWEWDGNNWYQLQPPVRPSPRSGAAMTYDAARNVCVLFGGSNLTITSVNDDTWEWNGTTWVLRTPLVRPPGRWRPFLAYDQALGQVTLFGGGDAAGTGYQPFADTWTWNGTSWQQRAPLTTPTARNGGGSAYDGQRGLLVTWGGTTSIASANAQTWVWNGTDWRHDPRTPAPAGRWATAAAYDLARGRTVLFGGAGNGWTLLGDTWAANPLKARVAQHFSTRIA
ncbi:MAG: kelch repeat-containing protein [Planctomycetota bacterium]